MAEGSGFVAGHRFEGEAEEESCSEGLAGSNLPSPRLHDVREALADRLVKPSLWEGPHLAEPPGPPISPRPFGSILFFDELDEITRDFMLTEFEASRGAWYSPTCRSLSPLGREAFPVLLHAVIGSAEETALIRALSYQQYWKEESPAGEEVISLVPLFDYVRASVRVAVHEFNAWYVRGLAARLLSAGKTKCEVHSAAASGCKEGACDYRDQEVLPLETVYRGCCLRLVRRRSAVAIPASEGCYHSIRRVRG